MRNAGARALLDEIEPRASAARAAARASGASLAFQRGPNPLWSPWRCSRSTRDAVVLHGFGGRSQAEAGGGSGQVWMIADYLGEDEPSSRRAPDVALGGLTRG